MFRKTYIEITNTCDLACDFCPRTTRPTQQMTLDQFRLILNQVTGLSRLLHFHIMGEPLLHPDVELFLDMCGERGFKVNIITNGMSLERVSDRFLRSPALRQVSISLHSLAGNAGARSVDGYVDQVCAFVKRASAVPKLFVSLRLWDEESGANPQIRAEILTRLDTAFPLKGSLRQALTDGRSARIAENAYINTAPRFEWPDLAGPDQGAAGFCLGLRDQFGVLVDGTVVPCCLDRDGVMALGNVNDVPVREILAGERARRIREGFSRGIVVEELCRRCSYRLRFGRGNHEERRGLTAKDAK